MRFVFGLGQHHHGWRQPANTNRNRRRRVAARRALRARQLERRASRLVAASRSWRLSKVVEA